jgi:hypothetical protein
MVLFCSRITNAHFSRPSHKSESSEKMNGTSKSDNDVFWRSIKEKDFQEKNLRERVDAMTMVELQVFMKETFESAVFYEVLRDRKMPTKELIAQKFDSVYHEKRLWGPQIFRRSVCCKGWAPCQKKDEMVDEMFHLWNQIGDVPFP